MWKLPVAIAVAGSTLLGIAGANSSPAQAAAISRAADPIVLTGAQIPTMAGGVRTNIVGFRWTGAAWVQLPVQIDERAIVNFAKIYNNPSASFYGSSPSLVNQLVYTSSTTFTGADPDSKFDANDELVFMARDSGLAAPTGTLPVGVTAGTGVEIHVTDPITPANEGFVYLFRSAVGSGLKQSAGKTYVRYSFKLTSGAYKTTYNLTGGSNPENSLVTAASYKQHFSNRWLSDQLNVTAPGATKVDILDRNKVLFAPNICVRSEDTFDATGPYGSAEGAFIVNKAGPVRAIRSYIGANSGPSTQRTHVFYDQREDVRTELRVHSIGSVMDLLDYSPAAAGMTYRNSANPSGVTIDGTNDSLNNAASSWEQVTGPQGTITHVYSTGGTFTPTAIGYYLDSTTPSDPQCTGDAFAYGTSGNYINSTLPCTDPGLNCVDSLNFTRSMFFDSPGGTAASASQHAVETAQPLLASTAGWQ